MTPIMEGIDEPKIGGRRRMIPGGRLLQGEGLVARGMIEAVTVASEMAAVARGEEAIVGMTVGTGDLLNDVVVIKVGAMVDLRKGMMIRGMIRGRPLGDSAHSSGPHWPQDEMGLNEARGLLRLRIR